MIPQHIRDLSRFTQARWFRAFFSTSLGILMALACIWLLQQPVAGQNMPEISVDAGSVEPINTAMHREHLAGTINTDPDLVPIAMPFTQVSAGDFTEVWFDDAVDETYSIAWGDMDGDGDLDLGVGNYGQVNLIYRNNGTGSFTLAENLGIVENTQSLAWGDMDGDGDLDLAVGNDGQVNRLYQNDGSGSFVMFGDLGISDNTKDIAWGDMDGDGDLDLAVGNYGQPNRLYLNNGSGEFTLVGDLGIYDTTSSIAWGDMDEDGDLDLVVGNRNQANRLYRNNGSGIFTLAGDLGTPVDTKEIAWGDMDNDGDLDLAVANTTQSAVFRNDGIGNFAFAGSLGISNWDNSIAWGDMDNDGDLDLVVGKFSQDGLYENDGNGVFTQIGTLGDSDHTGSIAWGDMDGDGDLDLAVGNHGDAINNGALNRLYENSGSGGFLRTGELQGGGSNYDIAFGDMDSDGDLDLAVVGYNEPIRLYRNDGRGGFAWASDLGSPENTKSIAWGDMDGDSDLDLVVGNSGSVNQLYQNDGNGNFILTGDLGIFEPTTEIAWGDMDSDGDLDLAIANYGGLSRLYENDGSGNFTMAGSLGPSNYASDIAWGDMDGDGDLDLAVGGYVNRLYKNDGSGDFTLVGDLGIPHNTRSIAWGDIDGDSDLDIAVGNLNEVNHLYENDGKGNFTHLIGALGTANDRTLSIAFGDMDGDGDIDLAVGNYDEQLNRLYQNDGNGIFIEIVNAFGIDMYSTTSVAWGDIDGDSDLDLATVANGGGQFIYNNRLYTSSSLPNNSPLVATIRPVTTSNANFYSSPTIIGTSVVTIPFTIFDPDGNAAGHLTGYYSLNGGGYWQSAIATTSTITSHLSGASFDDFDPGINSVHWTTISGGSATTSVCGGSPGKALNFNGSGTRSATTQPVDVSYGGTIYFSLKIGNANNASSCATANPTSENVLFEYSINNGASWTTITSYQGGNYSGFTPVAVPIPRAAHTANTQFRWRQVGHSSASGDNWAIDNVAFPQYFYWDTFASGFFGQSDNVTLRFEVYSQPAITGTYRYTNTTAGSFQHPYTSFTTFPFRVRGTQVRVFTDTVAIGNELPGAIVYRLPEGQQGNAQPMASPSSNQIWHTDGKGYLQGQGELRLGDQIMALYPITATQNYTIYYTSAPITVNGPEMHTVTEPGVQNLVVSPDNVLIVYNLIVSLEWDARQDTTYLNQLENDLRRTSEILYDLTNGQVVLGNIHIYHDRGFWGHANIVIQANNSQRPSAVLGGIVLTPTHDIGVTGVITNAYLPGQIRMPPAWNRFGDPNGTLGEDWPRTLAHELGHYLLFMPDNYLGLTPEGYLTFTNCFGSAMTDPYDESYSEFLRPNEWSGECLNTVAQHYLDRADWETINTHYPMLNGSSLFTGPGTLPLGITQIQTFAPPTATTTLAAPFFQLKDASGTTIAIPAGRAQAYLIKTRNNADPTDDYIIYQGAPVGSLVQARGAAPGDRLCVIDYSHEPLRYGCVDPIGTTATPLTLWELPNWEPQIIVSGISTTTVAVTVTNVTETNMMIQLLPALGSASDEVAMNPVGNTFTQTITAPDGAYYGIIRIWVPGSNPLKEIFLAYAIIDDWGGQGYVWGGQGYVWGNPGNGWGGQGYVWGGQAWAWGGQGYVWGAPLMSTDGQVAIFPLDDLFGNDRNFTLQNLVLPPDLPSWLTPVGQAYRLQASENMPQSGILFQYVARDVPLGYESGLHIYYSPDEGQSWQRLPTELDMLHNHASAQVPGAGVFVLISTIEMPPFRQGWNNFGYPVQETRTVTEALASIAGLYTSVYEYDPTQPIPWQLHDATVLPTFTPLVNTLENLQFGHAYWITVTQPVTLYLGVPTNPLIPPNNIQLPPATYYGWITPTNGFTPTVGMVVTAEINGVICGETQIEAWNGQLAYVLQVQAESIQGPPAGCGTAGRTVTFKVGSWLMDHNLLWSNSQAWYHPLSQIVIPVSGLTATNNSPTVLSMATTFTATVTSGSNIIYTWDFGDGNSGQGITATHTYSNTGIYTATVTAINPINSLTETTNVIVEAIITGLQASNDGPTALGTNTTFTATITTGSNVSYAWSFGDGSSSQGMTATHAYTAVGTYLATVTATNLISSQAVTTTVLVEEAISGLIATNSSPTPLGTSTLFSATIGTGSNVNYVWDFGDGTSGVGITATHIYTQTGVYTATVTASNAVGTASANTVVLVRAEIYLPLLQKGASSTGAAVLPENGSSLASVPLEKGGLIRIGVVWLPFMVLGIPAYRKKRLRVCNFLTGSCLNITNRAWFYHL